MSCLAAGAIAALPTRPAPAINRRLLDSRQPSPTEVLMRMIGLAVVLTLSLVLAPLVAEAQQPGKVYRVGILANKASDPAEARQWQALRLGLRERGWIEGENMLIEYRWAEGNFTRLPELAADLVRLKVDLIVARSSTFVQAAKEATPSIPIVFLIHADPVGTGHVTSLARPGGNITGLAILMTDLAPQMLELLIGAIPVAKRTAVLWDPDTPSHPPALKAVGESGEYAPGAGANSGRTDRGRAGGRLRGDDPSAHIGHSGARQPTLPR